MRVITSAPERADMNVRPYSKPVFASVSYPVIDVYN